MGTLGTAGNEEKIRPRWENWDCVTHKPPEAQCVYCIKLNIEAGFLLTAESRKQVIINKEAGFYTAGSRGQV